jgi:predicted nucleic acid-binding protein
LAQKLEIDIAGIFQILLLAKSKGLIASLTKILL